MTKNEADREEREREIYNRLKGLPEGYIQHNFALIDRDRHREISSKGGKASGEARRKKAEHDRFLRQVLDDMFFEGYTEEDIKDFRAWQRHRRYLKKKREAAGKL